MARAAGRTVERLGWALGVADEGGVLEAMRRLRAMDSQYCTPSASLWIHPLRCDDGGVRGSGQPGEHGVMNARVEVRGVLCVCDVTIAKATVEADEVQKTERVEKLARSDPTLFHHRFLRLCRSPLIESRDSPPEVATGHPSS